MKTSLNSYKIVLQLLNDILVICALTSLDTPERLAKFEIEVSFSVFTVFIVCVFQSKSSSSNSVPKLFLKFIRVRQILAMYLIEALHQTFSKLAILHWRIFGLILEYKRLKVNVSSLENVILSIIFQSTNTIQVMCSWPRVGLVEVTGIKVKGHIGQVQARTRDIGRWAHFNASCFIIIN